MMRRALLYRRPSEPSVLPIVFDRATYLVRLRRHRQARRYTLRIDAAAREVVLTIPPRGSVHEAKEFAEKHGGWIAARLKRLPESAPFADGIEVPLRGVPHRIAHRHGVRGTVWIEGDAEERAAPCQSPRRRLPQTRGAARSRSGEPRLCAKARRRHQARLRARSVEPLGFLLQYRRIVVLLAPHSGARLRARLSRGARSLPSDRAQPLAALLANREPPPSRRAPRQDLARRARHRSAPLWPFPAPQRRRALSRTP